uniref:Nucleoporin_N domain-containing protein n=1 Tax=Syphacia muris TaxID=451379 RepID=A0A0N5AM11_9BILA
MAFCNYVGQYGTPYISGEKNSQKIVLVDARVAAEGDAKKHELAICLSPIVVLADSAILVRFFEVSSKFKLFTLDRTWSNKILHTTSDNLLPVSHNDYGSDNPNHLIFRAEVSVFDINNCLLHSRKHIKYVASGDFDGTIVIYRNLILNFSYANFQVTFICSAKDIVLAYFNYLLLIVFRTIA